MTDTITLMGNIASTPESSTTVSGVAVLSFRLASNTRRYDARTSAWVDTGTNWYTVTAYRRLAENARDSLSKGDSVIIVGRLRLREWEANGKRGISAEVDADAIGADLRWGTSAYQRNGRSPSGEGGSGAPVEASRPADGSEPEPAAQWAVHEPAGGPF